MHRYLNKFSLRKNCVNTLIELRDQACILMWGFAVQFALYLTQCTYRTMKCGDLHYFFMYSRIEISDLHSLNCSRRQYRSRSKLQVSTNDCILVTVELWKIINVTFTATCLYYEAEFAGRMFILGLTLFYHGYIARVNEFPQQTCSGRGQVPCKK